MQLVEFIRPAEEEKTMDPETEHIVREEILRSIGILFFAFLMTAFFLREYNIPANAFTVLGIPFLITLGVFTLLARMRTGTGRGLKLEPGTLPYRIFLLVMVLYSGRFILVAIRTMKESNVYFGLFGASIIVFVIGHLVWEDLKVSKQITGERGEE